MRKSRPIRAHCTMASAGALSLLLCLSLLCLALVGVGDARNMSLILVKEAVKEGAVCLDGSAPGYYIGKGSGSGARKWILHQGGGGWCNTTDNCLQRSKTFLGSSSYWSSFVDIGGIFSDNATVNGKFHNWNVVYFGYCDGASFSGYLRDPVDVDGTKLYFRGKPILLALVQHLLQNGLQNATDVILTGCSAGGLATYLHADLLPALLLPKGIKYKAMADAGYFLNIPNVNGLMNYEYYMKSVNTLHNTSGGSDADCVSHYSGPDRWKCLFAPYTFPFIKSPVFVLNSLYDTAQLAGILGLNCLPPNCSDQQMKFFDNFRNEFLAQLAPALSSSSTGIFADSCLIHCQTLQDKPWATYTVGNQTMRETFEDWYFERSSAKYKEVDCPFPCNLSCDVSRMDIASHNRGSIPPPPPHCTPY